MTTEDRTRRLVCLLEAQNVGVADAPQGILEGLASAYGNTFMGEYGPQQIAKGSFASDLASKGGVIPIFYGHGWAKPSNSAPIGHAIATETAQGLKVHAELYINDSAEARVVWMAAAAGALREWSIGFLATDVTLLDAKGKEISAAGLMGGSYEGPAVERTDAGILLEASVVVKGANPKTTMTKVHEAPSADQVAEFLRSEHGRALLREVLNAAAEDEVDDENDGDEVVVEETAVDDAADAVLLAEKTERAWALLGSAGGHKVLREACYDARGTNDNPEVNQT